MFNTNIPLYEIFILLALISNILIVLYLSKNNKYYDKREIMGLLVYETIGMIVGSLLGSLIMTNYHEHIYLASYNIVIGIVIFILIFILIFKKPVTETLYIILPSIPLMYGIGKIGCFLKGCCLGIEYSGPLSVVYKYQPAIKLNTPLFPLQALEAIVFISISIYLIPLSKRNKFNKNKLAYSFIILGLSKFFLGFLKMDYGTKIGTYNQIISLLTIILGIIILIFKNKINTKY